MKKLISIIFLLFACNAQKASNIEIKYVDLDIMTPIDVSCSDFENLLKSQIKTIVISNQSDIDSLINILSSLKVDTTNYIPDVRVKLTLNYTNKSKIYCISNMGIYSDNISYLIPDNFTNTLKKYMK